MTVLNFHNLLYTTIISVTISKAVIADSYLKLYGFPPVKILTRDVYHAL